MALWARRHVVIVALCVFCQVYVAGAKDAQAAGNDAGVKVHFDKGPTEIGKLENGMSPFLNSAHTLHDLPTEMAGLVCTRRNWRSPAEAKIELTGENTVYILIDSGSPGRSARLLVESTGWQNLGKVQLAIESRSSSMTIYRQKFSGARTLTISATGYAGNIIAAHHVVLSNISPGEQAPTPTEAPPPKPKEPTSDPSMQSRTIIWHNAETGDLTKIQRMQSSIKALSIFQEEDGSMLGNAADLILTAESGSKEGDIPVTFTTPVGPQMGMVLDDVIRRIRVLYPRISGVEKIEFSFEDKYIGHDGGSIGAACGTLMLSMIKGFDIDPHLAMTGDVSADGKVRAIGGVAAKLRGAAAAGCTLVALPMDNFEQLVDAEIYEGLSAVTKEQVIGIARLEEAAAVARSDREPDLAEAIKLFAQVQKSIAASPNYLTSLRAQSDLGQVLKLAPDHLSAKCLLAISQGKQRKRLSEVASEYYTFVAVRGALPAISEQFKSGKKEGMTPIVVQQALKSLDKVRSRSDLQILPLVNALHDWIEALADYQRGMASSGLIESRRLTVVDELAKVEANRDLIEKMLHEGV